MGGPSERYSLQIDQLIEKIETKEDEVIAWVSVFDDSGMPYIHTRKSIFIVKDKS